MKRKELLERIGKELSTRLVAIEERAKSAGLKVSVRSVEGSLSGDFTIFVYDKSVKRDYMVGFDGVFSSDSRFSSTFSDCLDKTEYWIDEYLSLRERGIKYDHKKATDILNKIWGKFIGGV